MSSIKSSLVKKLTFIISLILFSILLFLDLSVDSYIENQLEHGLIQEGKTLVSLIAVENGKISLTAHPELMQEFKAQSQAKYFQIWAGKQLIEKSESLLAYPEFRMPDIKLRTNEYTIKNIELPNSMSGRVFIYNVGAPKKYGAQYNGDIYLGVTRVSESLENILILIDIVFLLTAIGTAFFIRYLVDKIVTKGLQPIAQLNQQIRAVNFNDDSENFNISSPPEEIKTIIDELNQFLVINRSLLQSEQRLTSDIAHELKTPITELLSVTEIAVKYPENKEVLATFKEDVISISKRMNNIVNSLLMLNKANNQQISISTSKIDLMQAISNVTKRLQHANNNQHRFSINGPESLTLQSDSFVIDAIITNLLNNALYYSPTESMVEIDVQEKEGKSVIVLRNQLSTKMNETELTLMFEPLWQKDKARTSENHFGLGLAIVKRLCEQMHIKITVKLTSNNTIEFTLFV